MPLDTQITFKVISIIIGCFLGFFSYGISKSTKGATKGWQYAAISGILLFLWAGTTSFFTIFDLEIGRVICGILFMLPGVVFMSLSMITLAKDFGMKIPDFFKISNIIIFNGIIFAVFFGYNLFFEIHSSLLVKLLSVSLLVSIPSMFIASVGAFYLWSGTKKKIWLSLLTFTIFAIVGFASCVYPSGCCNNEGKLSSEGVCSEFNLDYEQVIPLPCIDGLISMSFITYNLLIASVLILLGSFYYFWKVLT